MIPLAIQIAAVVFVFCIGLGIGWYVVSLFRNAAEEACQNELASLRHAHERVQRETRDLQAAIQQAETEKKQALQSLKTSTDHTDFQKLRKQLEKARKHIDALSAELKHREQQVQKLADLALTMKKQLLAQQENTPRPLLPPQRLPPLTKMEDDLQQIEGVTADIAHKLRSFGIINYRQLAECSPEQLRTIQRLIGQDTILPLSRWVKTAQYLFRTKYAHLLEPNHGQQQPPQSNTA